MSQAWRGGSTRRWRKTRALVLARDGERCRVGPDRLARGVRDVCTTRATQVHHLDGKAAGDDDPSRLVSCCAPCNLAEGDPTRGRATDPPATPATYW